MASKSARRKKQTRPRPFGALSAMLQPLPNALARKVNRDVDPGLLEVVRSIRKSEALTDKDYRIRANVKG